MWLHHLRLSLVLEARASQADRRGLELRESRDVILYVFFHFIQLNMFFFEKSFFVFYCFSSDLCYIKKKQFHLYFLFQIFGRITVLY